MPMSLANNQTAEIWKSLMQAVVQNGLIIPAEKISMAVYPSGYFNSFQPQMGFNKWAGYVIPSIDECPSFLESIKVHEGLYAKFHYTGKGTDTHIFEYIFREWLPASGYSVDDRPHFEVLGANYNAHAIDAEEDIFIPVCQK